MNTGDLIGVSIAEVRQDGNVVTVHLNVVSITKGQPPLFNHGEEMYACLTDVDDVIKGHLIVAVNAHPRTT